MNYLPYVIGAYAVFVAVLAWDFVSTRLQIRRALRAARQRALRPDQGDDAFEGGLDLDSSPHHDAVVETLQVAVAGGVHAGRRATEEQRYGDSRLGRQRDLELCDHVAHAAEVGAQHRVVVLAVNRHAVHGVARRVDHLDALAHGFFHFLLDSLGQALHLVHGLLLFLQQV